MMENVLLQVKMFGGLEVRAGDAVLVSKGSRLNKPMELLVYLLLNREDPPTNEQIMEALWEEGEVKDPAGTLKNAAYQLRCYLAKAGVGQACIITRGRRYCWNPDVSVDIDVQTFCDLYDRSMQRARLSTDEQIQCCRQALALYTGDFLSVLSDRYWLMTKASALRQRYVTLVLRFGDLLLAEDSNESAEEVLNVCSRAILLEPLSEEIYQRYFMALRKLDMKAAVLSYYPVVANLFMDEVGTPLPEPIPSIYHWASEGAHSTMEDIRHIQQDLDEVTRDDRPIVGAYFCPYEVFKHMYHMVVRSASRESAEVILLLVTMQPYDAPKQEMARVMMSTKVLIKEMLRKGDVFARYSRNQYILMLSVKSVNDNTYIAKRLQERYERSGISKDITMEITVGIPAPIV